MAQRTSLAAVLNGLVRNVDLTADELVLDSVRLGGLAGTLLTKTILDSLIANSHASGSDNQNIIAGAALTGGGSGASVTLDVNVDNSTIEINSDALRLKDGAVSAAKLAASAITGQTEETTADDADSILIYDDSGTALKKMTRANFLAGTSTDELVKVSANDTTPGYVEAKFVVDNGTNSTNPLEATTLNDGGDEDYRIRFDQSKVDHGSIAGLGDDDHTIYIKADGTRAFTGDQSMGSNQLTNVADPISGQDAATKAYVDSLLDGRTWKQAARVASTANIDLGVAADPSPVDGITLANNDRVLLKDQTAPEENGIYIAVDATDPTTWVRSSDANTALELEGAAVFVMEGTANADKQFAQTSDNFTLDTDPVVWVLTSANSFSGHDMIVLSGGQISVDLASDAGLESSNPGNAAGQLRVKLDGATLSRSASGLKVADGGITDTQVNASAAIAYSKLNLANSIVNADVNTAAAIAYSKLNLSGSIVNADISASAAIAYSKLNLSNSIVNADINSAAAIAYSKLNLSNSIVAADLTSQSVTNAKINTDVFDQSTITGGNGSAASVASAPLARKTMVAGESFAANTSFLVRLALTGETAGRVYKADSADAVANGEFWAIGMVHSGSAVSAGQNISVTLLGTHVLGSSDTPFASGDVGKALWLTDAGAFSITAPTDSGDAAFRVGSVENTDRVFIDGKQLTGIN